MAGVHPAHRLCRVEPLEARTLLSTIQGDLDYDGRITVDDYFAIDRGYANRLATYDHGDLDRSGGIDAADYLLLDRAFLDPASAPLLSLHLNAGGPAQADSLNRPFDPDAFFTGGAPAAEPYDVLGTTDDALFSSYRAGQSFTFSRPIVKGAYTVFLEFAEPTFTTAGQRVFDVTAEGQLILDDFDILTRAAPRTATAVAFDVHVTDGVLDLTFTAETGEALVSAIVAVPTDVPVEARPYSLAYAPEQVKQTASQSNLRQIGLALYNSANDHKGKFPADLASLMQSRYVRNHTHFANPRTDTAVPRGELTAAEKVAWVASLDDYLYLASVRLARTLSTTDVLAYENPARVAGPINVLFADAHVEQLDRAEAAQLIGFDPTEPPRLPQAPPPPADPAVVASAFNLFDIGQQALLYSNDNRGRFPADFGTLHAATDLDLETFVNPRLGVATAPPDDLTEDERAAWASATTDYIYLGSGRFVPSVDLLAHENPAGLSDGLLLLFTDGRVEFRETRWAVETLARIHD